VNTIIQITTSDREQLLELWGRLPDAEVCASVTEDGDVLLAIDLTATTVADEPDHAESALLTWDITQTATRVLDESELASTSTDTPERPTPQAEPMPVAPTVLTSKPGRARRTGPTCGQAIVSFLTQEPEIVFTTEQVAAALAGAFKESTVKFTLSEITRAGDITRVRPGLFQAKAAA
jgi:hypothetical protein